MGRHKLPATLIAERQARQARAFQALGARLEEKHGVLLASDPRMAAAIADMRNELRTLRGRASDFLAGDMCLIHPADAAVSVCGDIVRDSSATKEAHLVSCAPCLRFLALFFRASFAKDIAKAG